MTAPLPSDPVAASIIRFLHDIGLTVRLGPIEGPTFVPGIQIEHGTLLVDLGSLTWPGDLLHEAGHLALMTSERRSKTHINVGKVAAEEMAAIAWSYAASVHLNLDPSVVFHAGGYRGSSEALIENFTNGRSIGVPILQWRDLTADAERAGELGVPPYPHMIKWLRE
jgi:hypothetical protein